MLILLCLLKCIVDVILLIYEGKQVTERSGVWDPYSAWRRDSGTVSSHLPQPLLPWLLPLH